MRQGNIGSASTTLYILCDSYFRSINALKDEAIGSKRAPVFISRSMACWEAILLEGCRLSLRCIHEPEDGVCRS